MAGGSKGAEVDCTAPTGQYGSFIIASQADADALSNCSTITGNLVVQSNSLAQVTLNGISIIDGNFGTASSAALQKITAPALSQITHNFTLSNLPLLAHLNFPLLDNINGGIYWDTLPDLTDVSFGNLTASPELLPGTNVDGDILLSSTGLTSLAFLNFSHHSLPERIWIIGNRQLSNINLTGLSWGSNSLEIINNGPLTQISLPNLKTAGAIAIGNAGHIDIPSLSSTTTAGITVSNCSINDFVAPALAVIAGDLVVSNNTLLTDLNLPLLTSINGNFVVANNTDMNAISDLGQLWNTFGTINLSGNFSSVTLPDIRTVLGGIHITSSNVGLDCTAFDKLAVQNGWSSSFYSCAAYAPGSTKDVAVHYKAPNDDFVLSKPVKAIIVILSVIAGLFLCALLMKWYFSKTAIRRGSVTAVQQAAAVEEARESGEMGVHRQDSGDIQLPKYQKVGLPGEVLPVYTPAYTESGGESGNGMVQQVQAVGVNSEPQPHRGRARVLWRFW
ncbi:hypothetical protein DL95DRAFT_416107 [Leptodontidium sp. 2 PMI_412]|nr:hypothetical protein DL95DRAFT_416107 [Leptodontidium sp. 2 PMI_412]